MRRKACRVLMERTTQTKDLRFGITERAALCLVATQDQHEQCKLTSAEDQPQAMSRHGSGVRTLAQSPISKLGNDILDTENHRCIIR